MNYDGLDFTTGGTVLPTDMPHVTGAVTVDAGMTIRNDLRRPIFAVAADVTPTDVVAIKRFRLLPGATYTLPAPQGVWLVAWETNLRAEWAIGWAFTGNFILWTLAGFGAGDIISRAWRSWKG